MTKIKKIVWNHWVYVVSFVIPFLVMMMAYRETKVYPFGDYSFLKVDAFDQYAPFLMDFYRKLKSGASLQYSWNTGMGGGYIPIYAYYLASPVNWLVFFLPKKYIIDTIDVLILIKTSLCGTTFSYFLSKKYGVKNAFTVTIASCYALSSYVIEYCNNVIWLDCLMLFPLIILGVERLYHEKKNRLYFFSLALAVISNYYLSIIICIFLVIYYLMLVLTEKTERNIKEKLLNMRMFAVNSLLAGCSGAAIILPTALALRGTQSGSFDFPTKLQFYNTIGDIALRPFILMEAVNDYSANMYCSVIILLLVPMYLLNKKIATPKKIGYMALTVFMVISLNVNILDYIWHGFHFTNGLFGRNSFLYIFLVLVMSYEALLQLEELSDRRMLMGIVLCVAYIVGLWKMKIGRTDTDIFYPEKIVYLTLIFITMYLVIILLLKKIRRGRSAFMLLLLMMAGYELYMNSTMGIYSTHTRSSILGDNEIISYAVRELKEDDHTFFRIEKEKRRTSNDGAWDGYYGCTGFTSTANKEVIEFYRSLGLEYSVNYYAFYGKTPLTEALFSVKYLLSTTKLEYGEEWELYDELTQFSDGEIVSSLHEQNKTEYEGKRTSRKLYIYQNKYMLPLGVMVNKNLEDSIKDEGDNPFEALNTFYRGITGEDDNMFEKIPVETEDKISTFVTNETARTYFKYTISPWVIRSSIGSREENPKTNLVRYMTYSFISDLGMLQKDTDVMLEILDEKPSEGDNYRVYAYSYHPECFEKAYQVLGQSELMVERWGDTYVKGRIEAEEDGLLYTSIPYEKGWSVYVDGKKTNIKSFKGAFIAIELSKGFHVVTFEYHTPGLVAGIILSLLSVLSFIGMELYKRKQEKDTVLS